MMFHHDMIHAPVPHKATLLYSVEIPASGGDTLFASGYAAYDTLEPGIRARLEGRKARHHYNYGSTRRATATASKLSARRPIRSFARMRIPAARRSTSTA